MENADVKINSSTTRDIFAGQAMQAVISGLISEGECVIADWGKFDPPNYIAKAAYIMADCMIAARKKHK